VLAAQLDHLAAVVTLETISFGVIPADAEMHAIMRGEFILYEDQIDDLPPFAIVETPHASVYANDPGPSPGTGTSWPPSASRPSPVTRR
jgi:Domain of unknown function (DUF5753)